jgi:hypothetical protein
VDRNDTAAGAKHAVASAWVIVNATATGEVPREVDFSKPRSWRNSKRYADEALNINARSTAGVTWGLGEGGAECDTHTRAW